MSAFTSPLRIYLGFRLFEIQCSRVNTVTQARRFWTVGKNVAQVSTAACASDLNATHAVAVIFVLLYSTGAYRLPETRPSGTRLELLFGCEEWRIAGDAAVNSVVMVAVECA